MTHAVARLIVVLFLGMLALSGYASAVSYPVMEDQREEKAAKGIREKGETVCLFQSGTEDVRKTIIVGDVLIVSRQEGNSEQKKVGKIRILSYSGEDYIKAEVLEGRLQAGDVAKKGSAAGLVIFSDERCK